MSTIITTIKNASCQTKFRAIAGLFALALVIYGIFLRISPIGTAPYWMDEGYTINAVLSYAGGNTSGISAVLDSGATYECFLYCFPTAVIGNIFGFNSFNYRILAVIFGFLSILAVYIVARKLFSQKIALLSAFFMNFGYFQIAWSTQARWYTMFTTFFWLALLFFIKSVEDFRPTDKLDESKRGASRKSKIWHIVLAIIFTALAIMSQKIGIVLPIFFAIYLIWISFKSQSISSKKSLIIGFLAILGAIIIDTLSGQNIFVNFIHKITFNYNLPYYLSFFLREYLVFIPLVIFAIIENKKHTVVLVGIFTAYLIPLSFLTNIVHYRYMFHVTPIFFILGSVGLFGIIENIKWRNRLIGKISIAVFVTTFFVSGAGVLLPQNQYFLESDDPEKISDERPSFAYTPQPDWNSAYNFISDQKSSDDLIISSHPHFNKIFLNQAGYWIKYNYLGLDEKPQFEKVDREYYVGAKIINDLNELKLITADQHGYIVFDYMSIDGKIPSDISEYIFNNFQLVFNKKENSYSEVWVYEF